MLKIKNAKEKNKKITFTAITIVALLLLLFLPIVIVKALIGQTNSRTAISVSEEEVKFSEDDTAAIETEEETDAQIEEDADNDEDSVETPNKNSDKSENTGEKASVVTKNSNNNVAKAKSQTVVHPSSIKLSTSNFSLLKGQSKALSATVLPANTTNKSIVWASSNPTIVSVDANGAVTAGTTKGSAVITAKTVDGGVAAALTVNVVNPELIVAAEIWPAEISYSGGKVPGVIATLKISGGSGNYTASAIDLYSNGNFTQSGSRSVSASGDGTYYAKWHVVDAEEGEKSGQTNTVTIGY